MIGLVTSCGREDLLHKTLETFKRNQKSEVDLIVYEDSPEKAKQFSYSDKFPERIFGNKLFFTGGLGQHGSIELFLKNHSQEKYYVHLEDDWQFENSYDWIKASIAIMEEDPRIIKVLCNSDSPHPCNFDTIILSDTGCLNFGHLRAWENNSILWHGFSWNPGVTRLDLLKEFTPFPKYEQELAKEIYDKGYKVVRLEKGVCHHIGGGRSTHD